MRPRRIALAAAASAGLAAALFCPKAGHAAEPLQAFKTLDPDTVTVSGLSSGGFFAHQFHIAYSGTVKGAGIVAGGPYACAEQAPVWLTFNPLRTLVMALGVCTYLERDEYNAKLAFLGVRLPPAPDPAFSVERIREEHRNGRIDDPAHLRTHRVWLFSGGRDAVVPRTTVSAVAAVYAHFGLRPPRLEEVVDAEAAHGLPIREFTGTKPFPNRACGDFGPPYLVACGYDAAERILRHLYAGRFKDEPGDPDRDGRIVEFAQTEFFRPGDDLISMNPTGYLYVPARCENGSAAPGACRLHVAFHGCNQTVRQIGDDFYRGADYNAWAVSNDIVVLYPQTKPERGFNPDGCWDWWGYTGFDYDNRNGMQMHAVKAMIDRLLAR